MTMVAPLQEAEHSSPVRSPSVCVANFRVEEFFIRKPSVMAGLFDDGRQWLFGTPIPFNSGMNDTDAHSKILLIHFCDQATSVSRAAQSRNARR